MTVVGLRAVSSVISLITQTAAVWFVFVVGGEDCEFIILVQQMICAV